MKKILIIRFSSIGDIVLTSPVVRCLKQQCGDVEIHYLTKSQNLQVLQANPYISKIWLYKENFSELLPVLKSENFDFIADMHKNLRSKYVLAYLRRPSASFSKLNFRKWLLVKTRINILPQIHIVDRYMEVVKNLGVHNDGKGLDFFIAPEDEVDVSTFQPPFNTGYNAFVIGGKHNTKLLPEEKIAEICDELRTPVVLLGGPEDHERGEKVVFYSKRKVLNTCGKYSIGQSASVIRQAFNVITNDTGLMHVAAAFRKPIISVWGNTVPEFGMYPYYPADESPESMISEVKGLECRPCSKLGYEQCPEGHFRCMLDQDTKKIADFINERRVF